MTSIGDQYFKKLENRSLFRLDLPKHLKFPIIGHNSELEERGMRGLYRSILSLGLDHVIRRQTEVVGGQVWVREISLQ